MEVYTGRLQGSIGVDCNKVFLEEDIGELPVDERAGDWPGKCVLELRRLTKMCVLEYKRRVMSMMSVMQT